MTCCSDHAAWKDTYAAADEKTAALPGRLRRGMKARNKEVRKRRINAQAGGAGSERERKKENKSREREKKKKRRGGDGKRTT